MKKKENEIKKNLTMFEEEIENKKKLPQEVKDKILKKFRTNIIILIAVIIYLAFLQIGESNIQTDTYVLILKILNIVLIIGAIISFEISYRYNTNELILYSIEILIVSFFTLFLIPAYSLYYGNFYKVIICGGIFSVIYCLIKCIIIVVMMKKKYNKSLNDIKTIVAK